MKMIIPTLSFCPCTRKKPYADCCGVYHQGVLAPTARLLMPSRYSAYVLGLRDYLLNTWHSSTRPQELDFDKNLKWLGLDVKRDEIIDKNNATVEFMARYEIGGKHHYLHEISSFVLEDGRWYYVHGIFPE